MPDSVRPTTTSRQAPTLHAPASAYPDPIPGIIPFGSLCLFAGASGVGKTIMQAEWCRRWLDGRTICGHKTNCPTGFYYLAADRDWSTYGAAFRAVGFPDIPRYVLAEDRDEDPAKWNIATETFGLLERCLDKLAPIPGSLVYIDPVVPLFIKGNPNKAKDVAISMHYLRRAGRKRQITLICDANTTKEKLEEGFVRAQDRIAGSGAFVAYTDTQIYMTENSEPGKPPRTLGWTPRRAPAQEFHFQFDLKTELFVPWLGLLDEGLTAETDRPTKVLELFPGADEPISVGELTLRAKEFLNISRATLFRAIDILLGRGLIQKTKYGEYERRKLT